MTNQSVLTKNELIKSGYVENVHHSNTTKIFHPHAKAHYQKKVTDKRGIRYFINVYEYEVEVDDEWTPFQFALYLERNRQTIYIDISPVKSIEDMEYTSDEIWTKLGADYYEG